LEIRGLTVPSFKNNKILVSKGRNGQPLPRPLLITKPEFQKLMRKIEDSFVSQLISAFQTAGGETSTGHSLQSWIASIMPHDDCWTAVPEITVRGQLCQSGSEGATVTIEKF
jgi:hypothetical protein